MGNERQQEFSAENTVSCSPPERGACVSDRWCLGLAHPYLQRLIALAGQLDQERAPSTDANTTEIDK